INHRNHYDFTQLKTIYKGLVNLQKPYDDKSLQTPAVDWDSLTSADNPPAKTRGCVTPSSGRANLYRPTWGFLAFDWVEF
ncbi:hypothetical protein Q6283_29775, partial [Klebsiella pneumoniae]|uniref:hypothetical protein n=1 Tax=Klebsiella pneumoniae TaxID=573 RepID=UPI00273046D2